MRQRAVISFPASVGSCAVDLLSCPAPTGDEPDGRDGDVRRRFPPPPDGRCFHRPPGSRGTAARRPRRGPPPRAIPTSRAIDPASARGPGRRRSPPCETGDATRAKCLHAPVVSVSVGTTPATALRRTSSSTRSLVPGQRLVPGVPRRRQIVLPGSTSSSRTTCRAAQVQERRGRSSAGSSKSLHKRPATAGGHWWQILGGRSERIPWGRRHAATATRSRIHPRRGPPRPPGSGSRRSCRRSWTSPRARLR